MMLSEDWAAADELLAVDACLTGCGGWMNGRFFHCSFPDFILNQNMHINLCEMLTIVVALKLWGSQFSSKVMNTGATRNEFLPSCLREICFNAAIYHFDIKARHLSGCENIIPDLLSRWNLDLKFREKLYNLTKNIDIVEDKIPSSYFMFSHNW